MILFITPIEHITKFSKKLKELSGVFPYEVMENPTYESVKQRLELGDIHTLFLCTQSSRFYDRYKDVKENKC